MWATVRNLGVFQGLWFLLVLGGDGFVPVALCWLLYHVVRYSDPRERWLLPIYIALGIAMDSILAALNVYQFASDAWPIPLWLMGLWLIFPTTLRHGLRWCWSGKPWILVASAIGAALTYIGGARLSDLVFPLGELSSVVILSGCWILYFGLVRVMSSEKS